LTFREILRWISRIEFESAAGRGAGPSTE